MATRLLTIVGLLAVMMLPVTIAVAQLGDVVICHDVPSPGYNNQSQIVHSTLEMAQTFTTSETFSLAGVKIPVTRSIGAGTTGDVTIEIWPTSAGAPNQPGGVLASGTISRASLAQSLNTGADQVLNCNTTENPIQVVEFATPVLLQTGTVYAIVMWGVGTGSNNTDINTYNHTIFGNNYLGGNKWSNGAPSDRNNPLTWLSEPDDDTGFAVFGLITTPPAERNIDSWLINVLNAFQLNSTMGKLLIGGGFLLILMVALLLLRAPFLLVMALGGIGSVSLVTAQLISDAAFLAMVVVAGIGAFALVIRTIGGSGDG